MLGTIRFLGLIFIPQGEGAGNLTSNRGELVIDLTACCQRQGFESPTLHHLTDQHDNPCHQKTLTVSPWPSEARGFLLGSNIPRKSLILNELRGGPYPRRNSLILNDLRKDNNLTDSVRGAWNIPVEHKKKWINMQKKLSFLAIL